MPVVRNRLRYMLGESEVDACADPGAGDEPTVLHEQRIRVNLDMGIGAGQLLAMSPMRGRTTAVEQSECGEHECTQAHPEPERSPGRGPRGSTPSVAPQRRPYHRRGKVLRWYKA